MKKGNVVALILKGYAILNCLVSLIIIFKADFNSVVLSIAIAVVIFVNFAIFAFGEIIALLDDIKNNTSKESKKPGFTLPEI